MATRKASWARTPGKICAPACSTCNPTFNLYRIDERIAWSPMGYPAKKPVSVYFSENFHVTTAGHFRDQSLIATLLGVGADRVLFSTDYPFETVSEAATWFDAAPIREPDRRKIGRDNAVRLFQL